MNSKEALEKMLDDLKNYESYFADGGYYDNKEQFDIVKKDLEVLETLKDHIVYYPTDKYIMICVHKDKKEDFNKVKEWIERE